MDLNQSGGALTRRNLHRATRGRYTEDPAREDATRGGYLPDKERSLKGNQPG